MIKYALASMAVVLILSLLFPLTPGERLILYFVLWYGAKGGWPE